MLKIVSALLLAAMFIGCSESATTEAAPATEEVAPAAEAPHKAQHSGHRAVWAVCPAA